MNKGCKQCYHLRPIDSMGYGTVTGYQCWSNPSVADDPINGVVKTYSDADEKNSGLDCKEFKQAGWFKRLCNKM